MNNQKKDLNDILKELHQVLDELSSNNIKKDTYNDDVSKENLQVTKKDTIQPSFKETNLENQELSLSQQLNRDGIENLSVSQKQDMIKQSQNITHIEDVKDEPKKGVDVCQETNKDVLKETKNNEVGQSQQMVVRETSIPENVSHDQQDKQDENVINTIFISPSSVPETKDIFYAQLNSTLKRVSKKIVTIKPVYEIFFTNAELELVKNVEGILTKIKEHNVKCVFVVTNESVFLEDFVTKISKEVHIAKLIKYSELNTKSLYLDIAIDMLLILK
jgi:hypothetical protein